jgi:uncharacterized YigZ family protein
MSVTAYRTVARSAVAEVEVKRSRFIGQVARVDTEPDARAYVESIRRRHWDARHHCSAFVLGPAADVQRSSDDGEPSGTAGAPMLEVLRGRDLSDVVAVVTRYFGGVLLGAGGLVRAYSDAVRLAVEEAGVLERWLLATFEVTVGHAEAGRLDSELRARGVQVLGAAYDEQAVLRVAVPQEGSARLAEVVAELSSGTAEVGETGTMWVDRPE